jgi:membrane protease YdiL (CAAX protease family)
MPNPSFASEILAGALILAIPLTGPFERWAYRSNPGTPLKLAVYGVNIALLWGLAAAAVGIAGWTHLSENPAAGTNWLWAPTIAGPVIAVAVGAYMILALLPLLQSLRGPRWRQAYAVALRRVMADIPGLLPNTAIERSAWIAVSLTAGICEEVLFRGFLLRFLHEGGLGLPAGAALLASSLAFGLGHVYQGAKGVLSTTIAGLAFGLLFLLSGSLIACIVLHVLLDLQLAFVLRPVREDESAGAARPA